MSKIKNKNTKPELKLRKALWNEGIRYRINTKLTGKPDIVFTSKKIAIFVDGCFWHCCPIHGTSPKSNVPFWGSKLQKNIERDAKVNQLLKESGWNVYRIWEHKIDSDIVGVISSIKTLLASSGNHLS